MAQNNLINTPIPVTVANGGTGDTSLTAYAVLCGGTTSTGPIQSVAGLGTSGYALLSNGAGALPSFQAIPGSLSDVYEMTVFTASGTFTTPSDSTTATTYRYRILGGGGGGGGTNASNTAAGGGGAGAYAEGTFTGLAASTGVTITVGAGGAGGGSGSTGTTGGSSTIGSPFSITCTGGVGGTGGSGGDGLAGGAGGTVSAGSPPISIAGGVGGGGFYNGSGSRLIGGFGANSPLGAGGPGGIGQGTGQTAGWNAAGYGAGGGGAMFTTSSGGNGSPGIVIIERISAISPGSTLTHWNSVATSSQTLVVNQGYITNNGASLVTFTLPTSASVGDVIDISGYSAGGFTIAQNSGQSIIVGNTTSTVGVGGSVASTVASNQLSLLCVVANTTFTCFNERGNFTVT